MYNLQCTIKLALLLFTFYILHFTFYITPVHAQTPTPVLLPATVSPTSPVYTDLLVHNLFHSFSCLATGSSIIGQPCLTYQVTRNAQGVIQSIPVLSQTNLSGGALGATTSLIAALYMNPPVRTVDYLASLGESFGLVKQAKAQVVGSGANVLSPILTLWTVSRNIAYLMMIIIFVIVGLMVMFRNRINPQTVITAQAALPGLVIGLILITFSYFFAALLTDTAFIGTNLVGYYFSAAQPSPPPQPLVERTATENVGSIFSKYVGMISSGDISAVINSILSSLDGGVQFWVRLLAGIIGFQTGASIGGSIGAIGGTVICGAAAGAATAPVGGLGALVAGPFCATIFDAAGKFVGGSILGSIAFGAPGETFGLVLYFVAIAVLIYAMFKLLLRLINNYLTIIFLTITAPFQFLASSLPGRQEIATGWMLNMLCNILAFPAVLAVFYFVAYLWGPNTAPGQLFGISGQLNLTTNQSLPLFGGLNLNFIRILLAFGALLATPAIPDIICRTIGRITQAGQLIGQEITGGTAAGRGYAGRVGAAPGQLGGSLGQYGQQLGPTRTIVGGPLGPQVIRMPGILGGRSRVTPP